MHPHNFSGKSTQLFFKLFNGATESGRSMGVCKFGNILPFNISKRHKEKVHVFCQKKLTKSSEFHYVETGLYPLSTGIVEAVNTHPKKKSQRRLYHS